MLHGEFGTILEWLERQNSANADSPPMLSHQGPDLSVSVVAGAGMCVLMNMLACNSLGRSLRICFSTALLPAEPPIAMMSFLREIGISPNLLITEPYTSSSE
nr:hypothetical protein [Sphingobium yanoikuyae]